MSLKNEHESWIQVCSLIKIFQVFRVITPYPCSNQKQISNMGTLKTMKSQSNIEHKCEWMKIYWQYERGSIRVNTEHKYEWMKINWQYKRGRLTVE